MSTHTMHQHLYQRGYGFDLPIYKPYSMRGGGIGSILKSIVKFVIPFAKPLLRKAIPALKSSAISGIKQITSSKNPSIKRILRKEAIKAAASLISSVISGTPKKKTTIKRKQKTKNKAPSFVTNKKPKLARKWP